MVVVIMAGVPSGEIKAPSAGSSYGDKNFKAVVAQDVEEGLHCYGARIGVNVVIFLLHAEQYLILQISVFIRDGIEEIYIGIGCVPLICAGVGFDDAQMTPAVPRSMICGVSEHEARQFVFLQFLQIIQERHQRRVVLPQGLIAEIKIMAHGKRQGVRINGGGIRRRGRGFFRDGVLLRRFLVPLILCRAAHVHIGFGPESSGQTDDQHRAYRRQRRCGDLPGAGGVRELSGGFQLCVDLCPGARGNIENFRELVQLLPGGPGQIGLPFADGLP